MPETMGCTPTIFHTTLYFTSISHFRTGFANYPDQVDQDVHLGKESPQSQEYKTAISPTDGNHAPPTKNQDLPSENTDQKTPSTCGLTSES